MYPIRIKGDPPKSSSDQNRFHDDVPHEGIKPSWFRNQHGSSSAKWNGQTEKLTCSEKTFLTFLAVESASPTPVASRPGPMSTYPEGVAANAKRCCKKAVF